MKILIVGGVAGGATIATRLRRLDEHDEIILLERGEHISFANCGLPYYVGDVIKKKSQLLVQTIPQMSKRYNITIRNFNEVIKINRDKNECLILKTSENKTYVESFDKLIISTGAAPVKPQFLDGFDNVFTVRNIEDTERIKNYIHTQTPTRCAVVGGGFIGVEMADNLANLGLEVTVIENSDQLLPPLDFEMAQMVHTHIRKKGVRLELNAAMTEFDGKIATLDNDTTIETDMVIAAVGVRPDTKLAEGLFDLGERGHIKVNHCFNVLEHGTPHNDIFAIGDAIEVESAVDNSQIAVPLAWLANRQARMVADYIKLGIMPDAKVLGSNVIKIFDLVAASTGFNEKILANKHFTFTAVHLHRPNHATYYPNAQTISLKLIFDNVTKKILGAQGVGGEGTDKQIDVIATAMKLGATIYDLPDLEMCYAPPFSSAKSPVNMLGYVATNVSDGVYKLVYHDEISHVVEQGGFVLDVRTPREFANRHILGAVNVPLDDLRESKLPDDKNAPVYVYCHSGQRSYLAIRILAGFGYANLYNLSGGYKTYQSFCAH